MNRTPSDDPKAGQEVLLVQFEKNITYGTKINAKELKFEIELENDKTIRLINPSSNPRKSWQRLRNHLEIHWGDGHVTKWYARLINSGRFNRDSEFIPIHEYKNANVGDKFEITVICREPLVPIYCKLLKIWGEFPEDVYRVTSYYGANDDIGLFGQCNHVDYPEISLLNKHRSTVHTIGPDLLLQWRNKDMTRMFEYWTALREVPIGLFRTLMGNAMSYYRCFYGCDSLTKVDSDLLGLSNNVCVNLESMFEGCLTLQNNIHLQNSESLINVKSMYKDCEKLFSFDGRFLNYCPNIKYADKLFYNNRSLTSIGNSVLKFSFNIETISGACYRSGLYNTDLNVAWMRKCHSFNSLYQHCFNLKTITPNLFLHSGSSVDPNRDVNFDSIFSNSGHASFGCIIPEGLFEPLQNVNLKESNFNWFYGFTHSDTDLPKKLFHNTFKKRNNKNFKLYNLFSECSLSENHPGYFEFKNEIFTGKQDGLTLIDKLFWNFGHSMKDGTRKPILYLNKYLFKNMINLKEVISLFGNLTIDFKFPEDIFKYNCKIYNFEGLFFQSIYKFEKFPIDYIVRTTDTTENINLSQMYFNSNIRVYQPIHWSATRDVKYKMNNIINSSQSVPISYMLDGREQVDPNYNPDYKPRGIEYVISPSSDNVATLKAIIIKPSDEVKIDWGDGVKEKWAPTLNEEKSHKYNKSGTYIVKCVSTGTILTANSYVYETRGEFPYQSLDILSIEELISMKFAAGINKYVDQTVFRIARSDTNILLLGGKGSYVHPYTLKYGHKLESLPDTYTNRQRESLDFLTLPPRFYENCVNLKNFKGLLNISVPQIPDNIFPDKLLHNDNINMKMLGGCIYDGYLDVINKFHVKKTLYKDYMLKNIEKRSQSDLYRSYPLIPYDNNWIQEISDNLIYEKLTFVVRDCETENLGLESLTGILPNKIRIEIFSDNKIIDSEYKINSEDQLSTIIGSIDGHLNIINVYSDIPLWLTNKTIISEVRGVIPECKLTKKFKELAPNITRISETLFYRLLNTNYDEMFKDCSKLEHIPGTLFHCCTKANSFRSTFENCTSLFRVDDYMLICYDHDIDCTNMFKGCTGIRYVFKPICDSVLGRVTVTDMFKGCGTLTFEKSMNIEEQLFQDNWVYGSSGLVLLETTPNFIRATKNKPSIYSNNGHNIDENTIINIESSVYCCPINDFLSGSNVRISDYDKLGKSLVNKISLMKVNFQTSTHELSKLIKYLYTLNDIYKTSDYKFTDVETPIDKDLLFWNERLLKIDHLFKSDIAYFPTHTSFIKMCERIRKLNGVFENAFIRCYNDVYTSANLGITPLDNTHLNAQVKIGTANLEHLFNRNIECLNDIERLFFHSYGYFHESKLKFGNCSPNNMGWAFACDRDGDYTWDPPVDFVEIHKIMTFGYPANKPVLDNVWNNPKLTRLNGKYESVINLDRGMGIFSTNPNITEDSFLKKLCNYNIYESDSVRNIQAIYLGCSNLKNNDINVFENLDQTFIYSLKDIFALSGITKLPKINHLSYVKSYWHLFTGCNGLSKQIIPKSYIRNNTDSEIDISLMFANTNMKVENQFIDITSRIKNINIQGSLENCVSTIGDDIDIFRGFSYTGNSLVKALGIVENAFVQFIEISQDNTEVRIDYVGDHTTSIKKVNNMEVSWNKDEDSIVFNDEVDFATLRHTYSKAGTYKVQIRCEEFFCYVDTSDDEYPAKTVEIGQFKTGDAVEVLVTPQDDGLGLKRYFGSKFEKIANDPFVNFTNNDQVTKLYSLFSDSKLSNIPNNVLDHFINLTHIHSLFDYTKITSIPEDIFKYNINLTNINDGFVGTKISSIPENLFRFNSNIKILTGVFANNNNLITENISINLFNYLENITDISELFANNINMRLNSDWIKEIFSKCRNIEIADFLFAGCRLDNVKLDMLAFANNLESAYGMFASSNTKWIESDTYENTLVIENDADFSVPDEFFSTCTKLNNVRDMFRGRKNLKSYSTTLFTKTNSIDNFQGMFALTGITDIHKYTLFDNLTSSSINCSYMFYKCEVRDPANPISQHATRIMNIENMLVGTKGRKSEEELFNGVKVLGGILNSGYIVLYVVEFNVGDRAQPIDSIIVDENTYIQSPDLITLPMCKLVKWYKDRYFEEEFDFDTEPILSDITLYAQIANLEYVEIYSNRLFDLNNSENIYLKSYQTEEIINSNKIKIDTFFGTSNTNITGVYAISSDSNIKISDNIFSEIDVSALGKAVSDNGIVKLEIRFE